MNFLYCRSTSQKLGNWEQTAITAAATPSTAKFYGEPEPKTKDLPTTVRPQQQRSFHFDPTLLNCQDYDFTFDRDYG